MKILVIDDNQSMVALMGAVFHTQHHNVIGANGGAQALEILRSKENPDIIYVDHNMDEMDGPEFLEKCYEEFPGLLDRIPVILFTASERAGLNLKHVTEVLHKPFDMSDLLATVHPLVRHMHLCF
jgi:CheY-like chemotaxis protein